MKANPNPKADPKAEAAAPAKSSKKMIIIIVIAVLLLGGGGGGAWFVMRGSGEHGKKEEKAHKVVKPEFVVIEPFTVNLQPDGTEPALLQIQFTLEVAGAEQVEIMKTNMARIRSRVLLLLTAKKASEINTVPGKTQLSKEIIAAVNEPFAPKGPAQEVTDVLFTSFIIQ